ncbi:MAG TPA: glycosyltransferase family 39 protein [Candidatus Eisenbacteria bacterium]|nr:glycosyltransferase family 39 protein [Candidatus Eisenbacteria bacterium]
MRTTWWTVAAIAVGLGGVAYRLQDFGRYGFWTDEAWVALTTRMSGWGQWWLALSVTPIGWAALLWPLARLGGPPEVVLRLVPLAASLATLVLAYRIGTRIAGHPAGGLAALALIATDPLSIGYAKVLKQYSTEAAVALLALDLALRVGPGGRGLGALAAALVGGMLVSNSQPFVGAALLVAVASSAWRRGDHRGTRAAVALLVLVAIGSGLLYGLVLRPHHSPALQAYYAQSFLPATDALVMARSIATWAWSAWASVLGPIGAIAAVAAITWRCVRGGEIAVTLAIAVATLVALLLALSALRLVPLTEGRVLLFCTTLLGVGGIASLVACAVAPARVERIVASLALVLVVADAAWARAWTTLGVSSYVEDLGPLVVEMEHERGPTDRVLVYGPSAYVVAYYQRDVPVLVPWAGTTVGYTPNLAAGITAVGGDEMAGELRRALAAGARVWFVGSRIKATDAPSIVSALGEGRLVKHDQRGNAELVLVARELD